MSNNRTREAGLAHLVRAAAVAVAALVACQATTALAQPFLPAPPSILKQPAVDIGSAIALPDLIYSRLPGFRPLKLDLYKPKTAAKPVPVVIWLHGGAWMNGDPRGGPFSGVDTPAVMGQIASHGYVVASVAYRLTGEAKFPAQIQDVRAAIRWLRANAAEYGIDPTQVFITGGSAGGYLAALAGVSCGDASLDPPRRPGPNGAAPAPAPAGSECVKGVVAFYPVSDLIDLSHFPTEGTPNDSADSSIGRLLGCAPAQCPAATLKASSIIDRIDAKTPPFLILHGDADKVVPVQESRAFDAALKAKGVSSELIIVPGGSHTFPQITPAVREQLMVRVMQFLDQHTKR